MSSSVAPYVVYVHVCMQADSPMFVYVEDGLTSIFIYCTLPFLRKLFTEPRTWLDGIHQALEIHMSSVICVVPLPTPWHCANTPAAVADTLFWLWHFGLPALVLHYTPKARQS